MPGTLEAALVLIGAVLPGALHAWAFEREAGNWGVGLADRVLRFVGMTAVYQMAFAFPLYLIWSALTRLAFVRGFAEFQDLVAAGVSLPGWVWVVPVCYVVIPLIFGTLAGFSVHRWQLVSRILVGRDPAPRAWDHLFSTGPWGVIRARLKDDTWVGGLFAKDSYAAGYPEPPDLFLEKTYRVLSDGSFAPGSSRSGFQELWSGILIPWDEVKFLEIFR